ncbi:hypothetical protein [Georgenia sp. AZ-5]|uniref:hypothetical protein n=1 Tax=Georgenia sp. AZ-5 TaxID=3367526 RepID=UPI003753EA8F
MTTHYTRADRAALPRHRDRDVELIRSAGTTEAADHHAATALRDAAYWIGQDENTEALRLIAEAAAAHADAWDRLLG